MTWRGRRLALEIKNTKKVLRHRFLFILVEGSWLCLLQPIKLNVFFRPGVAPTTHWLGFQFGFSTPGTVGRAFGFGLGWWSHGLLEDRDALNQKCSHSHSLSLVLIIEKPVKQRDCFMEFYWPWTRGGFDLQKPADQRMLGRTGNSANGVSAFHWIGSGEIKELWKGLVGCCRFYVQTL